MVDDRRFGAWHLRYSTTGSVTQFNGAVTEPVWKSEHSWYLVATDDRMISPPAQRMMTQRAGATGPASFRGGLCKQLDGAIPQSLCEIDGARNLR